MKRIVGRQVGRKAVGLIGVVISIGLIVYAVPIVRAEYGRLFVADLETAVRQQRSLETSDLKDLAGVLRNSYAYSGDPAIAQELALVRLLLLEKQNEASQAVNLQEVAALLREGLAARPAAPHAWTRLARVHYQQERKWEIVRDALVLAITTGPTVRRLTVPRLEIGLRLWDRLNDYERGLVRRQARLAFADNPQATVRVALAAGRVSVVRSELTSLSAQARFDALVAQTQS